MSGSVPQQDLPLPPDPRLREAAEALTEGRIEAAERILRSHLDQQPNDVNALKLLAEVAIQCGIREDAELLLANCLQIAPDFRAARYRYAQVLFELNKGRKAVAEIDHLLRDNPGNPECLNLKAVALALAGDFEEAIACHEGLLRDHPERPGFWLNYAADLRAAGMQRESIATYRAAIERFPALVEAYWSLGNFKTFRFHPEEIEKMERVLTRQDLTVRDRGLLHFTLGKAEEDAGDYESSFAHYANANALRRTEVHHDANEVTAEFAQLRSFFTTAFFETRDVAGCKAPDAIFIVGLPRAGSTLLAQMLGSHSKIESVAELPNINAILGRLDGRYPDVLKSLDIEIFHALGEEYLDEVRALRTTDKPHFVDKMPDNFRHVGLIHLILPNATIIDMRRHPLACGFSNFKQDFEAGYTFANDLADFGHYYSAYVELMAHWDRVLADRVHRVVYERLIENPEREIRCALDQIGLGFEERCLRFYENERSIRTASSEQVRTPIFKSAVEQWRNYERWLMPLNATLGTVLTSYPDAPPFA
jgi:tetratricopeptide (TPR) repeat protein